MMRSRSSTVSASTFVSASQAPSSLSAASSNPACRSRRELEDVLVGHRNAREHHPAERTHVRTEHKFPSIEAVFRNHDEGTTKPAVTQPGEGSCGLARHKPTASPLPSTYPRVWHGLGTA